MVRWFIGNADSFYDGVVYRNLDDDAVLRGCLNRCRMVSRGSVLEPGVVDDKTYKSCRKACEQEHGRKKNYKMKGATRKKCKEVAGDDDNVFAACCHDNGLRYRVVDDKRPVLTTAPPIDEDKPYKKYTEVRGKTWYPDSLLYSCSDSVNGQCLYGVSKERCREIIENNPSTVFGQHLQTRRGGVCIPFMLANARWYANNRTPIENLVPNHDIALGDAYESTVFYDPSSFEDFITGNFYLRTGDLYVGADGGPVIDRADAQRFFVQNTNGHNIITLKVRHVYLITARETNNTLAYDRRGNALVFIPIVNTKTSRNFSYDTDRFFPEVTMDPIDGDKNRLILSFVDTRRVPYTRVGYLTTASQGLAFSETQKTAFRLEKAPVEPNDIKRKNRLVDAYYRDFLAQLGPPRRSFPWLWIAAAVVVVVVVITVVFFVATKK